MDLEPNIHLPGPCLVHQIRGSVSAGRKMARNWERGRNHQSLGSEATKGGWWAHATPRFTFSRATSLPHTNQPPCLGSITHLTFPSRSHLISASEDGTLCLFRARDWAVLRSLKGHKGRVNSVSVHPSGKVALSVGKDRTLYMWDLMRGRRGASVKLGFGMYRKSRGASAKDCCAEGELVRWSTAGSMLIVQYQKTINFYSTVRISSLFPINFPNTLKDLALLHTLEHSSRIHDVKFAQRVDGQGEVVLVAAEDKRTTVYEVSPDSGAFVRAIAYLVRHGNRYVHSLPKMSRSNGCTVSRLLTP